MQTITMMTRFLHAVAHNNTKALGKFEIIGTAAQANAAKCLYRCLLEAEGSPDRQRILECAHRLMDTIVCSKITTDAHIACPTDQAACLSLLRLDNHFGMANGHTRWFAMMQHGFFDITSHTVRLKLDRHNHYVPIDVGETHEEGALELEDGEGPNQNVRGEFTIEGAQEENDDFDLDDDEEEEDADEEERRLLEADQELSIVQQDGDEDDEGEGEGVSEFGFVIQMFPRTDGDHPGGTFMDIVKGVRLPSQGDSTVKDNSLLG